MSAILCCKLVMLSDSHHNYIIRIAAARSENDLNCVQYTIFDQIIIFCWIKCVFGARWCRLCMRKRRCSGRRKQCRWVIGARCRFSVKVKWCVWLGEYGWSTIFCRLCTQVRRCMWLMQDVCTSEEYFWCTMQIVRASEECGWCAMVQAVRVS